MKVLCHVVGHDPVGLATPWAVQCSRCGKVGFYHGEWIDAGPVVHGSQRWSEMGRAARVEADAALGREAVSLR